MKAAKIVHFGEKIRIQLSPNLKRIWLKSVENSRIYTSFVKHAYKHLENNYCCHVFLQGESEITPNSFRTTDLQVI